ncbi:MAG: hypothetical protein P4L51_10795 [Puia sp.]|nr:hypothetical protein [Puia sp.]
MQDAPQRAPTTTTQLLNNAGISVQSSAYIGLKAGFTTKAARKSGAFPDSHSSFPDSL